MATSRLFVSNLSYRTTEHDLEVLFQDYGTVERVELKKKDNLTNEAQANVIAFVTLRIDPNDVEYCINELYYRNLHGARFKVSLAKESFLDRLKRERDEAAHIKNGNEVSTNPEDSTSELLQQNNKNTRITFPEDEKLYDFDNIDAGLLITKKRAAHSMQNGKISIQANIDASPLHIIQQKKKEKPQLDSKSSAAEEKRIKSLKSMKNAYEQKKNAIQEALSSVNTNKSKKIKFEDAEDDEDETTQAKKPKAALFSDDEENFENENLSKLPEYKGKKGERLVEMQAKQSLDPRFKISEKFVDEDDEYGDNDNENTNATTNEELVNERDWQLGILEQVVGTKIDVTKDAMARNKRMLRYDPSKEEHSKYLRQDNKQNELKPESVSEQKHKQKLSKDSEENKSAANPAVSKEVFYVVTDTLQQSLKSRGDGFSLLNMFGSSDIAERDDQLKKISNEKILIKKGDKHHMDAANPFSYDSSASEDETNAQPTDTDAGEESKKNLKKKQSKKVSLVVESFFVPKNDARLKDGAKFFIYTKDAKTEQSYEEVRNRLKVLIKTKINKSKKNLPGNGGKKRRTKKIH